MSCSIGRSTNSFSPTLLFAVLALLAAFALLAASHCQSIGSSYRWVHTLPEQLEQQAADVESSTSVLLAAESLNGLYLRLNPSRYRKGDRAAVSGGREEILLYDHASRFRRLHLEFAYVESELRLTLYADSGRVERTADNSASRLLLLRPEKAWSIRSSRHLDVEPSALAAARLLDGLRELDDYRELMVLFDDGGLEPQSERPRQPLLYLYLTAAEGQRRRVAVPALMPYMSERLGRYDSFGLVQGAAAPYDEKSPTLRRAVDRYGVGDHRDQRYFLDYPLGPELGRVVDQSTEVPSLIYEKSLFDAW